MPAGALAAVVLVGGMIGGLIGLYLGALILRTTGRWLGGEASYDDMLVALGRGVSMPAAAMGALWIPQLLLFGGEMFTAETPSIDASAWKQVLFYLIITVELILAVWSVAVALKAIGEAHRFSAWRALGSALIPAAMLVGFFLIVGLLFSAL